MTEKIKPRIRKEAPERTASQPRNEGEVPAGPYGMFNLAEMFKALNMPENAQNQQVYENQQLMTDIGKFFFTSMMKFNHLINTHTNTSNTNAINSPNQKMKENESRTYNGKSSRNARNTKNTRNEENQTVSETNTGEGMGLGQYRKQNKSKQTRQTNNAAQTTDTTNERFNLRPTTGKVNRGRGVQERGGNEQGAESQKKLTTEIERTLVEKERQYRVKEVVSAENKATAREEGEYSLSTEREHAEASYSDFQAPTPESNEKQKLNLNIYRFINNCVSIKESTTTDTMMERTEAANNVASSTSNLNTMARANEAGNASENYGVDTGENTPDNSPAYPGANAEGMGGTAGSTNEETLLMLCFGGDLEGVKKLREVDLEFVDEVGRSAIHYACTSGNAELVRYLISREVEIDKKDVKGWTPLFISVVNNYVEIVELLLDAGADLTLTLRHRCAPTRLTDAHSNAIHFAAIKVNRKMTELLLSRNVDVNEKDSQGITPLSYSCTKGNAEYVAYLLEAGANPTIQDVNGRTSYHSVALGGSLEIAKLLYEKAGAQNTQDRWSLTPAKLAQIRGHADMAEFLAHPSRHAAGARDTASSDDSDDMYVLLSTTIASALNEPNSDQIYRCLTRLGPDVVKTLFELTLKVEKSGGVATADGKRLRTPGGVFFTLLKQMYLNDYITKEDYQYIRAAEKERMKSVRSTKANMSVTTATNAVNKRILAGGNNKYSKTAGNSSYSGTGTRKTNASVNKYGGTATRKTSTVSVSNSRRGASSLSREGRKGGPRTNDPGNGGNRVNLNDNRAESNRGGNGTVVRNKVGSANARDRMLALVLAHEKGKAEALTQSQYESKYQTKLERREADEVVDQPLRRLAFGSCQRRYPVLKKMYDTIINYNPDLFLFTGDNFYTEKSCCTKECIYEAYLKMVNHPPFQEFKRKVKRFDGIYDDHDYGVNDGDATFPHRDFAQQLLLDFMDKPEDHYRRKRRGGYYSQSYVDPKDPTNHVKVIVLDVRYHRSCIYDCICRLCDINVFVQRYILIKRMINSIFGIGCDQQGDVLGDEQWKWFESQLFESEARAHVIVSSFQVFTKCAMGESWGHLPFAKKRLLDLLEAAQPKKPIFLSGDIHYGELIEKYGFVEWTSSSLTHSIRPYNKYTFLVIFPFLLFTKRIIYLYNNFGGIDFNYNKERALYNDEGKRALSYRSRYENLYEHVHEEDSFFRDYQLFKCLTKFQYACRISLIVAVLMFPVLLFKALRPRGRAMRKKAAKTRTKH
ncbi:ankyrin repeat containing protein [Theileria orientalis strain Shintoku]|uniref:Ankyrin repeat containing protein n=1 Tax=Theileria orientalis strain Shintoku TaxID=869250 RepID=J4D9I8_THEOR|nr:ankyrin repeat containing protein [Theileria orientalis strain Shintoku]BAM41410.1 ankyrin repeat containing protein [Theileria orientalis strain Shintoku]|eukprot:XP_009691711.1 ankyrin repeat containing protein [Theileria orientalis strain Shintoku]